MSKNKNLLLDHEGCGDVGPDRNLPLFFMKAADVLIPKIVQN